MLAIMDLIKQTTAPADDNDVSPVSKDVTPVSIFKAMPFLEVEFNNGVLGVERVMQQVAPRLIKSHLAFPFLTAKLQQHPELRIVYAIRNPYDTLVSLYHQLQDAKSLGAFQGTWDQFFEMMMSGEPPFGHFFVFILEWYQFLMRRPNTLILSYEQLKLRHHDTVKVISQFMGYTLSDYKIDRIVQKTSSDAMSKEIDAYMAAEEGRDDDQGPSTKFIRKGLVGGWEDDNCYSQTQIDTVRTRCQELGKFLNLPDTDPLMFIWTAPRSPPPSR